MPSDPDERTAFALESIRPNIVLAQSFCAGPTQDQFHSDLRTVYAVIRCLEIISEASRRLPETLKSRHPDQPWMDIAGAGSVYRHAYDTVSTTRIWNTVDALTSLLNAVESEIAALLPNNGSRA